jgi:hypothetical protein
MSESFIGGKVRFMHKDRKMRYQKAAGSQKGDKSIVLGILERATEKKPKRVRATIISDRKKNTMQAEVAGIVEKGTQIYSDEFGSQWGIGDDFTHSCVDHLKTYVDGQVHTNGLENFWSLLKRGLGGTYIAVEPFHLFRYVDEQAFRFNNRLHTDGEVVTDAERFGRLCDQIINKRLTYQQLIGKETERPEEAF